MRSITVNALDGSAIGTVSVLGTTRIAEEDAMRRAAKLAAAHTGHAWGVAWQTWGEDGGTIETSDPAYGDAWNAGIRIARWSFTFDMRYALPVARPDRLVVS